MLPAVKRLAAVLLLVTALSGCATPPRDEWTQADTRRQLFYGLALAGDAYTTARISRTPGLYEGNRIAAAVIGEQPKPADAWKGAVLVGVAHYLIAKRMKANRRKVWQYVGVGVHTLATGHNCGNGLC